MKQVKKKVLMVFDLPEKPSEKVNYSRILNEPDYKDERQVYRALCSLGYEVDLWGIYDDAAGFLSILGEKKPDVVFFLCESFRNDRADATHLISLLQLAKIPFTGAPFSSQWLCRDKGLSKRILQSHGLAVPRFIISEKAKPLRTLGDFSFPAIVKPLELEASEGISKRSIVFNQESALEQMNAIHEKWQCDVIIEEFIKGREFYVGVMGNESVKVFPPREFQVRESQNRGMEIATYKAKWDNAYRKRRGISNRKADKLDPNLEKKIMDYAAAVYKALQLRGYARLDLRMAADEAIYFIEANPNPGISKDDDFAGSAKLGGVDYEELIEEILLLAAC